MAKTSTNSITNAIIKYLNYNDCFVWRNNTTGVYSPSQQRFLRTGILRGVSDILGVKWDGSILCVEIKSGKDRLSHFQIDFQKRIEQHNGIYIVARSFDDFLKQWNQLKQK